MASRRVRAFKRWMKAMGIEYSEDALTFTDQQGTGIAITALCHLKEGDVVAKIPKSACLTIKNSGARCFIEDAGFDGSLGLSVALMYERSLGQYSPWAGYLQLLPDRECLPLVWTLDEVDSLLFGTELHKTVKEDKTIIYEDWKECILPLLDSDSLQLNPNFFSVEQYFAAKSLIASRSFQIDDYHGSGMVPFADLFNHKTGAEDVHFTSLSSHSDSDNDAVDGNDQDAEDFDNPSCPNSNVGARGLHTASRGACLDNDSGLVCSSVLEDNPAVMEMIMVKDVEAGSEVYNTYGLMGNAALLHRYGFTEKDNVFDIVNIDMELVFEWSSSTFSARYSRARLSLWRKLGYTGFVSHDSEYFEISFDGEPQIELLILLYIIVLPDDAFQQLDLEASTCKASNKSIGMFLAHKSNITSENGSEISKDLLLTENVHNALLTLADMREACYGSNTVEDDIEALNTCSCIEKRKLYHSLMLRTRERMIIGKLRNYATAGVQMYKSVNGESSKTKLKRS